MVLTDEQTTRLEDAFFADVGPHPAREQGRAMTRREGWAALADLRRRAGLEREVSLADVQRAVGRQIDKWGDVLAALDRAAARHACLDWGQLAARLGVAPGPDLLAAAGIAPRDDLDC